MDIKRELYLGLLIDRERGRPVFMASAAGGMEIEEVPRTIQRHSARTHPPAVACSLIKAAKIAFGLGLRASWQRWQTPFLQALYRAFMIPMLRCWKLIRAS